MSTPLALPSTRLLSRVDGVGHWLAPLGLRALLNGAGRSSLDQLINSRRAPVAATSADGNAWGLVLFAIGATVSLLLPQAGGVLAIGGIFLMAWSRSHARFPVQHVAV